MANADDAEKLAHEKFAQEHSQANQGKEESDDRSSEKVAAEDARKEIRGTGDGAP